VYLYRETRLCIDLRDMDVAVMQQRSGCCGKCLTSFSFGTEMVLFVMSPYDCEKRLVYLLLDSIPDRPFKIHSL
jgi:hypothetical protein